VATPATSEHGTPVDLARVAGERGPLWGLQSDDLNATLLAWPAGAGVAEHVNDELDVLVLVLDGSASVRVDGAVHELSPGELLLVPRGSPRALAAGDGGVRYLSIHRRRGPLVPRPAAARPRPPLGAADEGAA
jgi:quercetin dioxygenase-like cupin family protein